MRIRLGGALTACGLLAACEAQESAHRDTTGTEARAGGSTSAAQSGVASSDTGNASRAAAGDGGIDYYSAALLAHVADSLARGPRTGQVLRSRDEMQYVQIRRGSSGVPEVHDQWADVTVVQSGRATLVTGGRVEGGHVETPGERRGGTIVGGASRVIGPGDLFIIPAGIPHQYQIAKGDSLRYITVKVREAGGGRRAAM